MKAFLEEAFFPQCIYIRIDLPEGFTLDLHQGRCFASFLTTILGGLFRTKGLSHRAILYAEKDADRRDPLSIVISHKNHSIGLFETVDPETAILEACAELKTRKLLAYSKIGWHDPRVRLLKIVHPTSSEEPFKPVLDLIHQWGQAAT